MFESAIARGEGEEGGVVVHSCWGPKKAVRALLKPYRRYKVLVLENGGKPGYGRLWKGAYDGDCGCSGEGGEALAAPLAVVVRVGGVGAHPLEGALERALGKDGGTVLRASVCKEGASAHAVSERPALP